MASYNKIIDLIDSAAANYAAAVSDQEKLLFDEAVNLTHTLEVTNNGKIKCSLGNINKLAKIKAALSKIAQSQPYLTSVAKLAKKFGNIQELQLEYYHTAFASKTFGDSVLEKSEAVKQIAVKYTIDGLTGTGIEANVLDGINKMLLKAVTSSESYSKLTEELYKTLVSSDGNTSDFARYANTYATTAMTQYAGQQNKLFTEDLGVNWFRYVGSNIETTRPICKLLTKKEYIHKSEIAGIIKGKVEIDGAIESVPLYDKTGLPYGMIEGTDADNFQVNVGGWNCRHQLIPIADAAVPEKLREKFDDQAKAEAEKKAKAEDEKKAREAAKKAAFDKFVKENKDLLEFDTATANKAMADNDFAAMNKLQAEMAEYKKKLNALDQLADNEAAAKHFTLSDLEKVNQSVKDTIDKWLKKHGYNSLEDNLDHAANKLQFEIDQVSNSKKYSTWEVARNAYQKKLDAINALKATKQIADTISKYKSFTTKSKVYADLLNKLENSAKLGNTTEFNILCGQLDSLQKKLSKGKNPNDKLIKQVLKHNAKSTNNTQQLDHLSEAKMSKIDTLKYIEQLTGVTDKAMQERLYDAVFGFSFQWDFEIRAVQTGNDVKSRYGHSLDDIVRRAIDLEEFLAKSPKWVGGTTYRGMSLSPKEFAELKTQLDKGEGNMRGSASWSTSVHIAENFSRYHIGEISDKYGDKKTLKVVLVTKSHEMATSIRYISAYAGENEVLASKKCRYRKIKDEYKKGEYIIIEVEPNI